MLGGDLVEMRSRKRVASGVDELSPNVGPYCVSGGRWNNGIVGVFSLVALVRRVMNSCWEMPAYVSL